jgi:hypothetical protein
LLLQESRTDVERTEAIAETVDEAPGKLNGPPPATIARRAKSYSDFYTVVRAHMRKEKALEKKKSQETLTTELEFAEWYGGISEELLEASHEEYRHVPWTEYTHVYICRVYMLTAASDCTRTNCT